MARTALAKQQITSAGVAAAYEAANADGHMIDGDERTFLHVKNGSAASINVTVQTPQQRDGLDVAERVVAVPAGAERFIGPFSKQQYNRPSGGTDPDKVYVDLSAVASVTLAALGI